MLPEPLWGLLLYRMRAARFSAVQYDRGAKEHINGRLPGVIQANGALGRGAKAAQ